MLKTKVIKLMFIPIITKIMLQVYSYSFTGDSNRTDVIVSIALNVREERAFKLEAKSRLSLQKWLLVIYLWAREYPVTDVASEANISARVAVDMYHA